MLSAVTAVVRASIALRYCIFATKTSFETVYRVMRSFRLWRITLWPAVSNPCLHDFKITCYITRVCDDRE